MNIYSRF